MSSRRSSRPQTASPAQPTLEAQLGYPFHDSELLTLALTHRSSVYEGHGEGEHARNRPGTDNEQMEFLGDAVLGLLVSELLLERFPDCDEGELTRIRASLVSRKRMAAFGAELKLNEHLLLGKSAEASGARLRPALHANAAEAVIAAMYLDAVRHGKDGLAAIRKLVQDKLVEPETPDIRAALERGGRGAMRDAKTLLQERVQAENAGKLRYVDTAQSGPPHDRRFSVEARLEHEGESRTLASADGPTKREAQQRAAELALAQWANVPTSSAEQTA